MSEDPARNRFLIIQAMRWIGTFVALFGLLVIYRRIDLPVEAGYAIFVIGLLDALVVPTLVARRWKSPPQ